MPGLNAGSIFFYSSRPETLPSEQRRGLPPPRVLRKNRARTWDSPFRLPPTGGRRLRNILFRLLTICSRFIPFSRKEKTEGRKTALRLLPGKTNFPESDVSRVTQVEKRQPGIKAFRRRRRGGRRRGKRLLSRKRLSFPFRKKGFLLPERPRG